MRLFRMAAVPVLAGLLLASQGCVVLKSKYDQVKADRDRLSALLSEKDKELTDAQDSFAKRAEALAKEIEMSKSQAPGLQSEIDKLREAAKSPSHQRSRLDEELRGLGIGEVRDHRLILQESILFKLGEDDLSPQGKKALEKLAATFKSRNMILEIDGHTDSRPVTKAATRKEHIDNAGLSAHRALAVYRYLEERGIPERLMYVRAFGSSRPAAGGGAKARRVEIYFIPMGGTEHKAPAEHKAPPKATTEPKATPEIKKPADTKKATETKTTK
jgi:flagellar motor protein MotB